MPFTGDVGTVEAAIGYERQGNDGTDEDEGAVANHRLGRGGGAVGDPVRRDALHQRRELERERLHLGGCNVCNYRRRLRACRQGIKQSCLSRRGGVGAFGRAPDDLGESGRRALSAAKHNPANLWFFGALLVGIVGSCIARFRASGMSVAAFATAISLWLAFAIAWTSPTDEPFVSHGVEFAGTSVFALMFLGSAALFRRSALNIAPQQ